MLVLSVGVSVFLCAATPTPIVIEDFESADAEDRWVFTNGPEFPGAGGDFAVLKMGAHSGRRGARLGFDFTGGGNYVQATVPLPPEPNLRWITLWLRKTVPNRMTFRCVDAAGETFQKSYNYQNTDWQRVRVDLRSWQFHWGGNGNGLFDEPPRQFGVLVERVDGVQTGAVYFDDICGEGKGNVEARTPQYSYHLPPPSERGVWGMRVNGPVDAVQWRDGQLRIDFPKGVESVTLTTHQSLLGRPQEIRFLVGCAGSALRGTLAMRSHFQTFEMEFSIPQAQKADTNDTVEHTQREHQPSAAADLASSTEILLRLGGMEGWNHHGGENDGVVRPPLRLVELRLEAPGDAPATLVQFHDLEVKTRVEPGEEFVVYGRGAMVDEKAAEFRLLGSSLLDEDVQLPVSYTVYSYHGKTLGKGNVMFPLRGGGLPCEAAIHVPIGDEPFAEAEFRVPLPPGSEQRVTANATRSLPPISNPQADPTSIFGMGLYLYRYPPTPEGFARMDAAASMAAAAGVKWSREEFSWGRIEPRRGEYSWDFYDRMVETAGRHGIKIYGLLCYWSPWTKPFTDEGIADYCQFVSATVHRYRDQIQHWEVWNEPNIFFWSGPKEVYARLLTEAYRTIKEADPQAKVLGCSTAGIDVPFIERVISAGGPFDILTIHPYRGDLDDTRFIDELRDTAGRISRLKGEDTPVWITEMGWPTQLGGIGEREAASRLARVYLCAAASGAAQSVSWYDFRNDGDDPFYNEANFGVVYQDLTPKPAYRALATVCRTLAGLRVRKELDWGDGLLAFLFEGDDRRVIALWSVAGDRMLSLRRAKQSTFRATDLMGAEAPSLSIGGVTSMWLRENRPLLLEVDSLPELVQPSVEVTVKPAIARPGGEVIIECRVPKAAAKGAKVKWKNSTPWPSSERRVTKTSGTIWQLRLRVPATVGSDCERIGFIIEHAADRLDGWISLRVVPETLEI